MGILQVLNQFFFITCEMQENPLTKLIQILYNN